MKHPILLLFWALIISPAVLSQNTARINEYAYIVDINNIKVSLDPTGSIGYSTTQPYYFNAPADSSTTAMYGSFFWLAGKNQYGETKAFTPDWYLNESEVHFGPYNYNYTNYLAAEYNLLYAPYNRVWMVTASEIQTHQQLFNSENYSIPEAILNWPGNGDTLSGFNAQLAPFVDRNNNLIYEPLAGDYPLIKGDAAIFAMYHDNSFYENEIAINGNTNTEIHVLLYAYAGDESTLIGNTIVVDYTIYNRGDFIFDSLYAGTFVDFAIGDFQDDYCGSDSALNLFFGYNGDLSDGPSLNTYTTLPAFGCMPLSHQLNSFMHFNGDNTAAGYPDDAQEFAYSLDGKFGDGLQMTSGGIGYNTSSIDYTNYMFGGDVNDDAGWTEITESNTPADRRGVGSIYLGKLEPDNSVCASFGFIFSDAGTSVSNTASVDLLKTYAAELKALYQAIDSQDCLERLYIPLPADSIVSNAGFLVYPNPTTDLLNIATSYEQNTSFTITIYNAIGGLVYSTELTNSEHSQIHTVSLNQPATGIYFIQIAYAGITTIYPVLFK